MVPWDRGNCVSLTDIVATRERWRKHLHNLIKLVINIFIWVKLYTFGGKYTHSGVNKSEMCSLEAQITEIMDKFDQSDDFLSPTALI